MSAQPQGLSIGVLGAEAASAVHQTLRREVNERSLELAPTALGVTPETIDVLCECAYTGCAGRLEIALAEYEAVRRFPTRFILKGGHEVLESERVVSQSDSYVVVEKIGGSGFHAVRSDPRRRRTSRVVADAR